MTQTGVETKIPRSLGAVAQLGERYNGIVEVVGSIPSGSTTPRPHRLVGLGHRPFTAATGVRIPLGTPIKLKSVSLQGLADLAGQYQQISTQHSGSAHNVVG